MGKGSENTFASESNSAQPGETLVTTTTSKTLFKWEEVRKHDKRNDCWIVVNGNVYNMTTFQNRHPGGAKVIQFYAGQDATVSQKKECKKKKKKKKAFYYK
jgi:cytochrome b involved in lipid metabolism